MGASFVACVLFINCLLMLFNLTLSDLCVQIPHSTCACKNSKGTIDLSPLSQPPTGKESRFATNIGEDAKNPTAVYLYNPCLPIKSVCSADNNCAVCQQILEQQYYSAGSQASAVMTGDPDTGQLTIVYQYDIRMSTVVIICNQSQEGEFKPAPGEGPILHYKFELRTKYGCYSYPEHSGKHSGISIGSVLVIIFFVLLLVYIVGGMLFLRYVRGAQGVEMFPNLVFWKGLPFLVKDGVVFVFRGCKTGATYTKI